VNIARVLSERAASMGDTPAIIDPARAVTFAELDRQSSQAAAQIARAGVRPGDPVLVVCPMSVDLYTVLIGLWRVGAHAVFLDPSAGRAHLEGCCRRVPPRALVAVPRAHLLRALSPALRRVPLKLAVRGWAPGAIRLRPGAGDALLAVAPADADTPALVRRSGRTAFCWRSIACSPTICGYERDNAISRRCRSSSWRTWRRASAASSRMLT
jgi:olefin beta-lactone synthetase